MYFSSDEVAVLDLLVLLLSPPWQYIRPCCSDTLLYVLLLLLLLLLHSHRVLLLISELFLPRLSPLGTEYAAAHRQHPAPATTLAHYHTCRLSPQIITLAHYYTCRLTLQIITLAETENITTADFSFADYHNCRTSPHCRNSQLHIITLTLSLALPPHVHIITLTQLYTSIFPHITCTLRRFCAAAHMKNSFTGVP